MLHGPWKITETNALERRNLFSLKPGEEVHIATILSGSSSRIAQFERHMKLIEAVPDMLAGLLLARQTLHEIKFLENTDLKMTRNRLDELIARLGL